MVNRLRSLFRALIHRDGFEQEMSEEMLFHIECRADDLRRSGLGWDEALRRARLEFGGAEMAKERCREERGLRWPDELARNLSFSLRLLRNNPGFALGAIATLGLCIGANTAIFSVVDAVLLRPLPYPDPYDLRLVATRFPQSERGETTAQDGRMWEAIRDHADLSDRAVYSSTWAGVNLVAGGHAEHVVQQRVSSGFFRVLGVPPSVGREFDPGEDRAGGQPVAILSQALAIRLFSTADAALGKPLILGGEPHTVVGVMPADFTANGQASLWAPLVTSTEGEGEGRNYSIVVRPKPGVHLEQAQAQIASLGEARRARRERSEPARDFLAPLRQGLTSELERPLYLLWAAVAMVLLIGCVNIAGLLLARSAGRSRELSVRMALGGGRAAIVRQLLTESLVLALAGGACGLFLGYLGTRGLRWLAADAFDIWQSVDLDHRVLLATAGISLLSCLLVGLLPALQSTRVDVRQGLNDGGSRGASGSTRHWARRLLVVAEVALGVVLLVGAGLLIRTFSHLRQADPGFDPRHVLTARISLRDARYGSREAVVDLYRRSLEAVRAIPGIESAAIGLSLPYERPLNIAFRPIEKMGDDAWTMSYLIYVTPDYFRTLGIRLRRGRAFAATDRIDSAPVLVVNEAFARRYSGDRPAVGRRLVVSNQEREVVGVVSSALQRTGWGTPADATPTLYLPVEQVQGGFSILHTWFTPAWIVRTQLPDGQAFDAMRRAMAQVDPQLPFAALQTMNEVRAESWSRQRVQAVLLGSLAGLALLLSAIGIYGLIAAGVAERKREIGIRMALGSTVGRTVRAVAGQGIRLAAAGAGLGLLLAWLAASLMETLVIGVAATDLTTFLAVPILLLLMAALASLLPSLRVAGFSPSRTLRDQ